VRIDSYFQSNFYGLGFNYRINSTRGVKKHLVTYGGGNRKTIMNFKADNVGIGIAKPDYKLTANRTMGCEEVKVEDITSADKVFEDDYDLKSLSEVEDFVKTNKHLPEISTEKDIRKKIQA